MLLKLKNVGRLKSAEVNINGITVICGNNNTGKSTVGKILYCIYASLHELEKNIRDDKIETLKNSVAYAVFLREKGFDFRTPDKIMPHIQKAVDNDGTAGAIIDALRKLYGSEISEAGIKELYGRIDLILKMSLNDMAGNFITRRLDAEFGQRLGNVNRPKTKSYVELKIKDDSIVFHVSGSKNKLTLENFFSLHKNIIYIDDPFVMDEINALKDSLLILCDLCDKRLHDARKEIIFVLVINSSRTDLTPMDWRGIIEANKSGDTSAFCGLDKIAGVFVKTVFIFDIDDLGKKLLPRLTDI